MKLVTMISLIPMILLIAGTVVGIIIIINLINGNYIETKYLWNGMSITPDFYSDLVLHNETGVYAYNTVSGTGENMLKLCGACYLIGVGCIIYRSIRNYLEK